MQHCVRRCMCTELTQVTSSWSVALQQHIKTHIYRQNSLITCTQTFFCKIFAASYTRWNKALPMEGRSSGRRESWCAAESTVGGAGCWELKPLKAPTCSNCQAFSHIEIPNFDKTTASNANKAGSNYEITLHNMCTTGVSNSSMTLGCMHGTWLPAVCTATFGREKGNLKRPSWVGGQTWESHMDCIHELRGPHADCMIETPGLQFSEKHSFNKCILLISCSSKSGAHRCAVFQ